jgi:superoxide dismutase, Cu-Zn family
MELAAPVRREAHREAARWPPSWRALLLIFPRSVALLSALALGALPVGWHGAGAVPVQVSAPLAAHADIIGPVGTPLGTAKLSQIDDAVKIELDVIQQVPGSHAVHILSVGKCEEPDFGSAGVHFNPYSKLHGTLNPDGPHAGDLPNFDVASDGHAHVILLAPLITLANGPNSLFHAGGTSIVIDESPDDYRTDPDGKSGIHVACGVIVKN